MTIIKINDIYDPERRGAMSNGKAVLSTVSHSRFLYTPLDPACFWDNMSFEGMVLSDPCTGKRCLKTRDPKTGRHLILVDDENVILSLHTDGKRVRVTKTGDGLSVTRLN